MTTPLDIDIDIAFKNSAAFAADENSHMLRLEKSKELSQGRKSRQEWVEFYTGVGWETRLALNKCINTRKPPVFNYPPISYSPIGESNNHFGIFIKEIFENTHNLVQIVKNTKKLRARGQDK